MNETNERAYDFGPFRLYAVRRALLRDGQPVPLTAKAFETFLVLVESGGRVLLKDELMTRLWLDTVVEENNLTQQVSLLRKALGERAGEHRYVVTVPGRGYVFVAEVRRPVLNEQDLFGDGAGTVRGPVGGPAARLKRPRILAAALSLLALAGAWSAAALRDRAARPEALPPAGASVAVLPFRTLGDGVDQETGAVLADALTTRLSNIRRVSVSPTSAVMKYAGRNVDTAEAGRALGVESIVDGTVQKFGNRVRVTVRLIRVRDRRPVWAGSFDERFTDIFSLQDSISDRVAVAVLPELSGEERSRVAKRSTENLEAHRAYVRARHLWNKRDEVNVLQGADLFRRAVELDPAYAAAHAGLADSYLVLAAYGYSDLPQAECLARARAAALRAVELDDELAEGHASLAVVLSYTDANGAEREFRRAVGLNPSYATARHWYSEFLAAHGRGGEALAEIERASRLDPLSPIIMTTLGERLYFARQYDRAAEQLRRVVDLEPGFRHAHYMLGLVYGQQGRHAAAVVRLEEARRLSGGGDVRITAALGRAYAVAGRRAHARELIAELSAADAISALDMALLFESLGDRGQALGWLRRAQAEGIRWACRANRAADPRFDDLRSVPEFQHLLT